MEEEIMLEWAPSRIWDLSPVLCHRAFPYGVLTVSIAREKIIFFGGLPVPDLFMKSQNDVFTVRTNSHGTVHLRDTRKATNKETSIAVLSDILALAVSNDDGKHVAVAYCSMRPSLMVIAQPSNTDWAPVD